jgi:hypothetical protein
MKKRVILVILTTIVFSIYSQQAIETNIYSDDYRFGGSMTNEIFKLLKRDEQKAYLLGLEELGVNKDSVNWCDNEFFKKLGSDDYSFSQKNVWVDTKELKPEVAIIEKGKDFLTNPRIMLFFRREKGVAYFTFQVYF